MILYPFMEHMTGLHFLLLITEAAEKKNFSELIPIHQAYKDEIFANSEIVVLVKLR